MELVAPTPAPSSTRGFSQTKKAKLCSLESEPHLLSKLPLITHPVPQGFSEKSFPQTKIPASNRLPHEAEGDWGLQNPWREAGSHRLEPGRTACAHIWPQPKPYSLPGLRLPSIPLHPGEYTRQRVSQTGMGVPCRCSKSGVRRSTGNTTASWIKCYGRKQTIGKGTAVSKGGRQCLEHPQGERSPPPPPFQNAADISQYIRLQSTKKDLPCYRRRNLLGNTAAVPANRFKNKNLKAKPLLSNGNFLGKKLKAVCWNIDTHSTEVHCTMSLVN